MGALNKNDVECVREVPVQQPHMLAIFQPEIGIDRESISWEDEDSLDEEYILNNKT